MFSNKAHADLCVVHLKHHLNVSFTRQKQWLLSLRTAGPVEGTLRAPRGILQGGLAGSRPSVPQRRSSPVPCLQTRYFSLQISPQFTHATARQYFKAATALWLHRVAQSIARAFLLLHFGALGLSRQSGQEFRVTSWSTLSALGPLCGVLGLCICAPSRRAAASPSEGRARPRQPRAGTQPALAEKGALAAHWLRPEDSCWGHLLGFTLLGCHTKPYVLT